ncbi:hydroxypyruvate isomerase family protein [Labedella endophytica]|uniref:Hydroxypyruvate isomerase n=1 Tax=Labedella endophytica TaxID=1523160 RepID=A0A3S0VG52_9MICO|nr:TIM barrel protein [Labedella endophytica]RUR00929.1 hydroxypyruvate isomerase [Labedella endophytica]
MPFSANLSILFTELPFLDRFAAAKAAGFDDVECWWAFSTPVPTDDEVTAFLRAIDEADVSLRALNLYAGDMPSGDRGVLSHPGVEDLLAEHLVALSRILSATGCRVVNALYGCALPDVPAAEHADIAVANLRNIADVLSPAGVVVVVEPLTRGENGTYPLETVEDAIAIVDRVDRSSVRVLFDAYHLHNNGMDLANALRVHAGRIGHVQIADSPGRHEPGSGTIDFDAFFAALDEIGYDGFVGCEYRPASTTTEGLGWLARVSSTESDVLADID